MVKTARYLGDHFNIKEDNTDLCKERVSKAKGTIVELCALCRGLISERGKYAIPKIKMLCNLHCLKARLRLLCNRYQRHSSLNLVSQQLKLHNIFIFGMAHANVEQNSRFT